MDRFRNLATSLAFWRVCGAVVEVGACVVEILLLLLGVFVWHIISFSLEKDLHSSVSYDPGFTFVFKTRSRIAFYVVSKQKQNKKKIPCFGAISIFQRPKSDGLIPRFCYRVPFS